MDDDAAATAVVSSEQLQEYERQLADVNELLKASPDDAALLSLRSDLEELLALTKASLVEAAAAAAAASSSQRTAPADSNHASELPIDLSSEMEAFATAVDTSETNEHNEVAAEEEEGDGIDPQQLPTEQQPAAAASASTSSSAATKKKSKKMKEFEVPAHLLIHEADTEAEKNRKRRAIKALKNKWREKKKEVETEMKQQSWQSFQQKTLKKRGKDHASIFATQEGEHAARVGVVSASRGMTEFGERKRHKHNNDNNNNT